MKLTEALALVEGTERGIARLDNTRSLGTWHSPEEMSFEYEDLTYEGWEVEPEVTAKAITIAELKTAWEKARQGMVSVKPAGDSKLFNNLAAALFGE
jgi:hypothetical protein